MLTKYLKCGKIVKYKDNIMSFKGLGYMREEKIETILKLVDEIWQGNKDKNIMKSVVKSILLMVETYYFNKIEYDLIALKESLKKE